MINGARSVKSSRLPFFRLYFRNCVLCPRSCEDSLRSRLNLSSVVLIYEVSSIPWYWRKSFKVCTTLIHKQPFHESTLIWKCSRERVSLDLINENLKRNWQLRATGRWEIELVTLPLSTATSIPALGGYDRSMNGNQCVFNSARTIF